MVTTGHKGRAGLLGAVAKKSSGGGSSGKIFVEDWQEKPSLLARGLVNFIYL